MTIRLSNHTYNPEVKPHPGNDRHRMVVSNGTILAYAESEPEAEAAKRAFERVLAPRFTRDEAIAIVMRYPDPPEPNDADLMWGVGVRAGIRNTLEALAAAGVFVDGKNMADRLDAVGI